MEKELDINVIKATQSSLGKYIKRPPLNEKLLKKPPFRFLHDIVTNVLKTTGFFEGLFDENELVSDNVKDRESKVAFLNKVITVLALTTGKSLPVKPSKIVAGQEPDKTNELLQSLAQALDDKLSSTEAVKKYKEKDKPQKNGKIERTKEELNLKKTDKKNSSKTNDKAAKPKKETAEPIVKNEKDKTKAVKTKPTKPDIKKTNNETKKLVQSKKKEPDNKISNTVLDVDVPNDIEVDTKDLEPKLQQATETNIILHNHKETSLLNGNVDDIELKINELNEHITNEKEDEEKQPEKVLVENHNNKQNEIAPAPIENINTNVQIEEKHNDKTVENERKSPEIVNETPPNIKTTIVEKNDHNAEVSKVIPNLPRPQSVRPPSSRPGAPRLKEKHEETFTNTDLLVGKVNIIVESAPNDEEEETSLIVVEDTPQTPSSKEDLAIPSTSNQHGHLVQQILDSQKQFSQIATGKTVIEWEFDSQKAKEASYQEVELLKVNIESLSRISNPLGKLLDHVQEDVEVMRQELQQWNQQYTQAAKELAKQKTANEESLSPLLTKIKQLDADIQEKREKIHDLNIIIHRKSTRINNLLASGDVQ